MLDCTPYNNIIAHLLCLIESKLWCYKKYFFFLICNHHSLLQGLKKLKINAHARTSFNN